MSLDKDTVRNIANLARIKVPDEDLGHLAGELSAILQWVEQLNGVDTDGIEPLASVVDVTLPLRTDAITDGNCRDAVLANAPDSDDGFFAVPKVLE
ncbi:MAG TPA: Asp-tRNA(Asn)/Glu-tRNA(Gln) amidotransferase subunit GatC [Rhodospirillales bacterium]|nr:Asp-tRNA(Asn)/Glu-tRNA(Gln) amidotransferase subunit GatC [Rhodospirillales bacterium]